VSNLSDLDRRDRQAALVLVKGKKQQWERELAQTDDPAERAALTEQIEAAAKRIAHDTNKFGGLRPEGHVEESRNRVSKAINNAKRAITRCDEHIGEHFKASVKADGTCFVYRPDRIIDWTLK
jgi:hypothetical protein